MFTKTNRTKRMIHIINIIMANSLYFLKYIYSINLFVPCFNQCDILHQNIFRLYSLIICINPDFGFNIYFIY